MSADILNDDVKNEGGFYLTLEATEVSAWCRNPRKNFDPAKEAEMNESVKRLGVRSPITVRPVRDWQGDDELTTDYVVVCGERRLRAAKATGRKIGVMVDETITEKEAYEVALVENMDREELDIFEEAGAYAELMTFGYSVVELAERFGKSREWMGQQISLLGLNQSERKELMAGTIAVRTAVEILKLKDKNARKNALEEVVHPKYQTDPLSRDKAVAHVRDRFVKPAAEQEAWESQRGALEKKYPGALVLSYEESRDLGFHTSDYVESGEKPSWRFNFECICSEDPEEDERPTWGELGEKYGARLVLAAPVEPKGKARECYAWEPLETADIEQAMGSDAVFRKPSSSQEGKEAAKEREAEIEFRRAQDAKLKEEKRLIIKQLSGGSLSAVLPSYVETFVRDGDLMHIACAVCRFQNPEKEMDEEEEIEWVKGLVSKRGMEGLAWLLVSYDVVCSGVDLLKPYAEAVGNAQEFPMILAPVVAESDEKLS